MKHSAKENTRVSGVRFSVGTVVSTLGALELIHRVGMTSFDLLARHQCGDWGCVPPEDAAANEEALQTGARIFSSYLLARGERVWIITEADRSSTTLLLPDEY